jgi:N-acetylmuramoyl-L-alanine amidase
MVQRIKQRRFPISIIVIMTLAWILMSLRPQPSWAASAKSRYFAAERCYRQLLHHPEHQKYRDRWFQCINGFLAVYKQDPGGVWAAASLYQAATLYAEMFKHSFFEGDKQEASDLYYRIIRKFPKSQYRPKAVAARSNLMQGLPSDAGDSNDEPIVAKANDIQGRSNSGPDLDKTLEDTSSDTPAMVEGLRFWSNPRYTRVVIDVNQDTIFTYHELRKDPALGKPQRIYIDMHGSRLAQNLQKTVPINDDLLKDARAGQYAQDIVRVVIDIKSSKTFKIFSLKNPFRVVLDVWGQESESAAGGGVQEKLPPMIVKNGKKIQPSAIAKQLALGVRRIVIDPGHGGKDYGAPGYLKGVNEKNIVLQIARRLAEMIHKQLKCDTIMTRDTDKYISLEERTAIANTQNADLFVSIHTNASPDKRAYGVETYILNLATDDEAIRVAAMENATSAKNISDLDSILQDLMQNAKVNESTRLASYVQDAMNQKLIKKYNDIRNKGIKQAPFYVLLGADMPSILVETSFISNPRECKRLTSARYQNLVCQGIVDGIRRYMEDTNPLAFKQDTAGKGG